MNMETEKGIPLRTVRKFQTTVLSYFRAHGRELPWRKTSDPYCIMVSEVMLQQTQVARVINKHSLFMGRFPTVYDLATAPLPEVLRVWQGLGYNRRAKFLHHAAKIIVDRYGGRVPQTVDELNTLPGVGKDTAAAICVYAYNMPLVFVETNIRTVYIHHFFKHTTLPVSDKALLPFIEQTLYKEDPRVWYSALMDYGSMLKITVGNKSRLSQRYVKQKKFIGSIREARGKLLRFLLAEGSISVASAIRCVGAGKSSQVIASLIQDGLIKKQKGHLVLCDP